jgi:hypothetical protein
MQDSSILISDPWEDVGYSISLELCELMNKKVLAFEMPAIRVQRERLIG